MMAVVGSDTSFRSWSGTTGTSGRPHRNPPGGRAPCRGDRRRYRALPTGEIQRAVQLPLPHSAAPEIPVLYIEMDGTGVPVVPAETEGRCGKNPDEPAHRREVKLGCVFTQTDLDDNSHPMRDEASTTYTGAIEPAENFGRRIYTEALHRGWDHAKATEPYGSGTSPTASSRAPFRSSIFTIPGSASGVSPASCFPLMRPRRSVGPANFKTSSTREKSNRSSSNCAPFPLPTRKPLSCFKPRRTISSAIANACAIPRSAAATSCRLRSDRGSLQDRDRQTPQTIRNVLDRSRSQRHHRSPLHQPPPKI